MLVLRSEQGYVQSLTFASDAATLYAGHMVRKWKWDVGVLRVVAVWDLDL